jgi:hypothetical protein
VEVLSVNMEMNVRLFVEFVEIEVFNSNTYIIIKFKVKDLVKESYKLPVSLAFSTWNL